MSVIGKRKFSRGIKEKGGVGVGGGGGGGGGSRHRRFAREGNNYAKKPKWTRERRALLNPLRLGMRRKGKQNPIGR